MKLEIQNGEGDAEIRICSLNRYFPDDMAGECEQCHKDIFYRPEPPYKCMFICQECGEPYIMDADSENECRISPNTLKFLKENAWLMEGVTHPHLERIKKAIKGL